MANTNGTTGANGGEPQDSQEPTQGTHPAAQQYSFETRAVHAGYRPDPYTGASAVPLYQSSAFAFEDTSTAAAYFNLQEYGNIYSRIMNPTVAAFEERIANLEGGALVVVRSPTGSSARPLRMYLVTVVPDTSSRMPR